LQSSKKSHLAHMVKQITTVFEQGMDEGQFRRMDAAHAARMFLACISELFETQMAAGRCDQVDAGIETLLRLFLYGVSAGVGNGESLLKDRG
jgi:hypothetical protein